MKYDLAHPIKPIPQAVLNIENKTRSNLFSWRGQFSPQLVDAFITAYAKDGYHALDPFAGSGTVLFECARHGLHCTGVEVNPAAGLMARVYELVNLTREERDIACTSIESGIQKLIKYHCDSILNFRADAVDYTKDVLLLHDRSENPIERIIWDALIVLLDIFKNTVSASHLFWTWNRLRRTVEELPYSRNKIQLHLGDARGIDVPDNSIDLVITSPPYINVFNYHQQYRRSVEALGYRPLESAKSEIGANRKFRGNRFLTVIQYCIDMVEVLIELSRVCKPHASLIFVMGRESQVRKTSFQNGEILGAIATQCSGFEIILAQERVFTNRFGQQIYEDIIHLRKSLFPHQFISPHELAKGVLSEAMNRAPGESLKDLMDAIDQAYTIKPSPRYRPNNHNV